MDIVLFATKSCPHRPLMEGWLQELDVEYRVAYAEEEPDETARLGIQHSPSLVIDGELVFQGMPSSEELEERLRRGDLARRHVEPASFERIPAREHARQLPEPVPDAVGMYRVDATWGTIQPMEVAAGVRTVGELEVIEQLQAGLPVIDARTSDNHEQSTLPGALNIPHPEAVERMDELDRARPTIFFCNGPQCAQSPWAITALLEAGYPPAQILYYRGGVHDWVTLGLPTVPGTSAV